MLNDCLMTQVTGIVSSCVGIEPPADAADAYPLPVDLMRAAGVARAERALLFCPDAVALWLYQRYTSWYVPVLRHAPLALPVRTMLPSVTPVCFGTMFTGVTPHVHGIECYDKHVLAQDSLFDALVRAGKRVALVAVADSSFDILFSDRAIDRFILPYDGEVAECARELIEADEHDVVVVYNQEFDDVMHATYPESKPALEALRHHIATFDELARRADSAWADHDRMVAWLPDHGVHIADNGHGQHGSDREDDLNTLHFYGFRPARQAAEALRPAGGCDTRMPR